MDLRRKIRDRRHSLLLALARRGNEDAFGRLYRELFDPVNAYVRRRIDQREDAEDITAQVFAKFLRRLDSFDAGKGSVLTWVVAMARNAVIDHYRRRKPETFQVDDLAELLAGGDSSQLQEMVRDEQLQRVQRLLARQPAEIREIFTLRFEQGMKVHEAAAVVGLSPDAAKQKFSRTFRKLQLQLRDEEQDIGQSKGDSPCAATD